MFLKASIIRILIVLTLKNIEYKASIIGILIMLALKNIKYKASIIGILIILSLKNINYKTKGQLISKQNCRAITSPKKQTLDFYF